MTTTALDVAEYILQKSGPMTTMTLHRLVYYCQAWHLAWDGEPLFDDPIAAWSNGPVVPALFELHRRRCTLRPGQLSLAAEARTARVEVRRDPDRQCWIWSIPNLVWGGPPLTGTHPLQDHCIQDGVAALRETFELGMKMLDLKPWPGTGDESSGIDLTSEQGVCA